MILGARRSQVRQCRPARVIATVCNAARTALSGRISVSFFYKGRFPMNSPLAAAAALTTVLIASGCAGTDLATANASPREEPVYRTGSNIPLRDKAPMTNEEKEKRAEESRGALQQMPTSAAKSRRD